MLTSKTLGHWKPRFDLKRVRVFRSLAPQKSEHPCAGSCQKSQGACCGGTQQAWGSQAIIRAYCLRRGILGFPLCKCRWVGAHYAGAATAPGPAAGQAGTLWGQLPCKARLEVPAEQHQQSDAKADLYQLQLRPPRYLTCFPIANYVSTH